MHAGVISDERGGFVDVMPVEKKKSYVGSLKNGVQSERWVFFFVLSSYSRLCVQWYVKVNGYQPETLVDSKYVT